MEDKAWKKVNDKPKPKIRKIDQDLLNAAYFGILLFYYFYYIILYLNQTFIYIYNKVMLHYVVNLLLWVLIVNIWKKGYSYHFNIFNIFYHIYYYIYL